MHSVGKDWRNKNINMLDPRQYNIESYYTDALQKKEMKHSFGEDLLNNLHLLPDPLKKNLADTIITSEEKTQTRRDKNLLNMTTVETEPPIMEDSTNTKHMPSFAGISNFFSGVLSVISGAVAQLRPKSPAQYYDCYDSGQQGPPQSWHTSNGEVQNKSVLTAHSNSKSDMNIDCKAAAAQCEDKLNKVRFLLTTKPIETPKRRPRRPKKVFVEPGSVEESFEDAFAPEDFISVPDSKYIEYYSKFEIQKENLLQTSSPKVKTEKALLESTDIVKTLPVTEIVCEKVNSVANNMVNHVSASKTVENNVCEGKELEKSSREELVSSCEDKLSKLKALLQEKRKKNTTTITLPASTPETAIKSNDIHRKPTKVNKVNDKPKNKHYKNPCRTTDKRKKGKLRKSIQDDLLFAQEINNEELSSVENSPSVNSVNRLSASNNSLEKVFDNTGSLVEYFDEVSGRFRTASTTESEDSFQIVFKDSVKDKRVRHVSDCESEDSFIVFEETPGSCYTSTDVFGDSDDSGSEYTDSESELSDTEDVLATKICHKLSRTLSDLTDGSLYEDKTVDEVDCAVRSVCDIASQEISDLSDKVHRMDVESNSNGVLLNDAKKQQRKDQPPKSVSFSSEPPKVHVMRVWAFAARQARAGHWERCALDRDRFKRRIADVDMALSWVLKPQHRSRVMFQRFMPWWNAQRRKELAEKKARAEEERVKEAAEEESKRQEAADLANGNADALNDNDCEQQQHDNEGCDSDVIINDATNDKVGNGDIANKDSVNIKKQDTYSHDNNGSVDSNTIINDATNVNIKNGDVANTNSVVFKKQDTSDNNTRNDSKHDIINDAKSDRVANGDIANVKSTVSYKYEGVVIKNELNNKSTLNANVPVHAKFVPVNGTIHEFKSKCRNETLSNT